MPSTQGAAVASPIDDRGCRHVAAGGDAAGDEGCDDTATCKPRDGVEGDSRQEECRSVSLGVLLHNQRGWATMGDCGGKQSKQFAQLHDGCPDPPRNSWTRARRSGATPCRGASPAFCQAFSASTLHCPGRPVLPCSTHSPADHPVRDAFKDTGAEHFVGEWLQASACEKWLANVERNVEDQRDAQCTLTAARPSAKGNGVKWNVVRGRWQRRARSNSSAGLGAWEGQSTEIGKWMRGGMLEALPARVGEAANPGPPAAEQTGEYRDHDKEADVVRVFVGNITHLPTALDVVVGIPADVYCLQEVTTSEQQIRGIAATLRSKQLQLRVTPCPANATGAHVAGVATMARTPRPLYDIPLRTPAAQAYRRAGRLQIVGVGLGQRQSLILVNVYGWTRGADDVVQAHRTDLLLRAAREELILFPTQQPVAIVGDLNAGLRDLRVAMSLLSEGWVDIGAVFDDAATCRAQNALQGNRRDFVLANAPLLCSVKGFEVMQGVELKTHCPLILTMKIRGSLGIEYWHHYRPRAIVPELHAIVEREAGDAFGYGEADADLRAPQGTGELGESSSIMTSEEEPASLYEFSDGEGEDNAGADCCYVSDEEDKEEPCQWFSEAASASQRRATHEGEPPQTTPATADEADRKRKRAHKRAIWERLKGEVACVMDAKIRDCNETLNGLLRRGDTDTYWVTWSQAVEESIIEAIRAYGLSEGGDDDPTGAKRWGQHRGRGVPVYKRRLLTGVGAAAPTIPGWDLAGYGGEAAVLRKQTRRIEHLHKTLKARIGRYGCEQAHEWWAHLRENSTFAAVARKAAEADDRMEGTWKLQRAAARGVIDGGTPAPMQAVSAMAAEVRRMVDLLSKEATAQRKERRRRLREDLSGPDGLVRAFARLRTEQPQPLRAVQLPDGRITATPEEVDAKAREDWGRVYNGADRLAAEAVRRYVTANAGYLYERSEPVELRPITGEDIGEACRRAKTTAAGPDAWAPAEWRLLSTEAVERLADLLNAIEGGAQWPRALVQAHSAYLSKDASRTMQPLAYRVLALLPVLYRRWAAIRLRHLQHWVEEWRLPEMYAGVPGPSAADATWLESLDAELADARGEAYAGAGIDCVKAFDRVERAVVYEVLRRAGLPESVVDAYARFQEDLTFRNILGLGVGQAHAKRCAISQGCPLSMPVFALLLRPWILRVRRHGVVARSLADDIKLFATCGKDADEDAAPGSMGEEMRPDDEGVHAGALRGQGLGGSVWGAPPSPWPTVPLPAAMDPSPGQFHEPCTQCATAERWLRRPYDDIGGSAVAEECSHTWARSGSGVEMHTREEQGQLGSQCCGLTRKLGAAVEETLEFLDSMGADISVGKSHVYASDPIARQQLRAVQWGGKLQGHRGGCLHYSYDAMPLLESDARAAVKDALRGHADVSNEKPNEGNHIAITWGGATVYVTAPTDELPGIAARRFADLLVRAAGAGIPWTRGEYDGPERDRVRVHVIALQGIPVVEDGRFIGAHFDSTGRKRGTTLTERMRGAAGECERIARLPIGLRLTRTLIAAKVLPMALYGAECTPANADAVRKLRSAVQKALLGPAYPNASPELSLSIMGAPMIDPEARVLEMRLTALRRELHLDLRGDGKTYDNVLELLSFYEERGEYMIGGPEDVAAASPAPPAASEGRKKWALSKRPAGPVGLLLHSIGVAGLIISTDLTIRGPFGGLNLMRAPYHLFRRLPVEAACDAAVRALHVHRPLLAPLESVDWELTKDWVRSKRFARDGGTLPRSERHALAFASGGHWRQHRMHAAGHGAEKGASCLLCGAMREDDEHIWSCPKLAHVHARHPQVHRCRAFLPISLRAYGVVPRIRVDPRVTFWGADCEALCGDDARWLGRGSGAALTDDDLRGMMEKGVILQNMMGRLSDYLPFPTDFPLPDPCEEAPPDSATVYADGSVTHPSLPWAGRGALGLYWPAEQRQLAGADWIAYGGAHPEVQKILRTVPGCCVGRCALLGARQTSTRVEAQGLLAAMCHDGPQHIVCDNAAAIVKWWQIWHMVQGGTLRHELRRRPWGLRNDGDVWEAIAEAMVAKGPTSLWVRWTKGHATEEDVATGLTSAVDRQGNKCADALADKAHHLSARLPAVASNHAAARWGSARTVVRAVHDFLEDALMERQRLRSECRNTGDGARSTRALLASAAPVVALQHPWYPTEQAQAPGATGGEPTRLIRRGVRRGTRHAAEYRALQEVLAGFLVKHPWVPQTEGGEDDGITWVELMVGALLQAGVVEALRCYMCTRSWPNQVQEAADPVPIFKALRVAIRAAARDHDIHLPTDNTRPLPRMRGWGIHTRLAGLQGWPVWPDALRTEVIRVVLDSQCRHGSDHTRVQLQQRLEWRQFSSAGFAAWLTKLAKGLADRDLRATPAAWGSSNSAGGGCPSGERMAEPRPCAAQVSDEKPVPRPVTQGGTKRPSQPSQRTTRGHSSARCDVRSQGAPNGSRRGNAIAGSHLARTHLCDAANWRCGVCGAHFQGDLGVAPPARAPARWCRSKQCKCMRRLATAICCVCENTWSNCQCARLAPPADQERRRSQLRLTGYRTGPDAPTSHGKLVEVPTGARSRGVGLSTREVAPGPPRGDPVRAAPSPLVEGNGHGRADDDPWLQALRRRCEANAGGPAVVRYFQSGGKVDVVAHCLHGAGTPSERVSRVATGQCGGVAANTTVDFFFGQAPAGLRGGQQETWCQSAVAEIGEVRPGAYVLEAGGAAFATECGGHKLLRWLQALRMSGRYRVNWAVMDAQRYGLPLKRSRLYVWGIQAALAEKAPDVPAPLSNELPLEDVLEKESRASECAERHVAVLWTAPEARNVGCAEARACAYRRAGSDAARTEWVVDPANAKDCRSMRQGGAHFPTSPEDNSFSVWVGSRRRFASLQEHCRARGYLPDAIGVPRAAGGDWWCEACRLVPASVLAGFAQALVPLVMPAARHDRPWSTGAAQRSLATTCRLRGKEACAGGGDNACNGGPLDRWLRRAVEPGQPGATTDATQVSRQQAPDGEDEELASRGWPRLVDVEARQWRGDFYGDLFSILGAGAAPRVLAGRSWRSGRLLPKGVTTAGICTAMASGRPFPQPTRFCWALEEAYAVAGALEEDCGIGVVVSASDGQRKAFGLRRSEGPGATGIVEFALCLDTGHLVPKRVSPGLAGAGGTVAARFLAPRLPVARHPPDALRAWDQGVPDVTNPGIAALAAVLVEPPWTWDRCCIGAIRTRRGDYVVSKLDGWMPRLARLLVAVGKQECPGRRFTTIRLSRVRAIARHPCRAADEVAGCFAVPGGAAPILWVEYLDCRCEGGEPQLRPAALRALRRMELDIPEKVVGLDEEPGDAPCRACNAADAPYAAVAEWPALQEASEANRDNAERRGRKRRSTAGTEVVVHARARLSKGDCVPSIATHAARGGGTATKRPPCTLHDFFPPTHRKRRKRRAED